MLLYHSREVNGLLDVKEGCVLVGLGCLQDLLQEGLLVIPDSQDCLVLRGQVTGARRDGILHGLVGLLLDDDVVLRQVVVVIFLVGGTSP
jgi:hypothetical protein